MPIESIKTISLSDSKNLELSLDADGKVIKVEVWLRGERIETHLLSYPISEDTAVEKYKHSL